MQRGQLSLYIMHAGPITLVKCSAALCEASARAGDGYAPRLCISEGAQKNRLVGAHRRERGCEEAHRALLYLPPVLPRGCASRVDQNQEKLSPTLAASPPSEQQVHSKVSLRRAVDAVSRCGVACVRSGAQGQAARRASSLRAWRWRVRRSPCPSCPTTRPPYVPCPSAVDHLI